MPKKFYDNEGNLLGEFYTRQEIDNGNFNVGGGSGGGSESYYITIYYSDSYGSQFSLAVDTPNIQTYDDLKQWLLSKGLGYIYDDQGNYQMEPYPAAPCTGYAMFSDSGYIDYSDSSGYYSGSIPTGESISNITGVFVYRATEYEGTSFIAVTDGQNYHLLDPNNTFEIYYHSAITEEVQESYSS